MTGKAKPTMVGPLWPSEIHNGLVKSIMPWLHPGVKFKTTGQLINKLVIAFSGMGQVLTFEAAITTALRPIPRPYHHKQALLYS